MLVYNKHLLSNMHGMNIKVVNSSVLFKYNYIIDMIYLLKAIGLSPGGSTHLHTDNT